MSVTNFEVNEEEKKVINGESNSVVWPGRG